MMRMFQLKAGKDQKVASAKLILSELGTLIHNLHMRIYKIYNKLRVDRGRQLTGLVNHVTQSHLPTPSVSGPYSMHLGV